MAKHYFSIHEANAALALVRPIMRDLIGRYHEAVNLRGEIEALSQGETMATREALKKKPQLQLALEHLANHVDELMQIGCDLKDFETGLLDFPALHQGKEICFCWKYDESHVKTWHEIHTGFIGRKPITEEFMLLQDVRKARSIQR